MILHLILTSVLKELWCDKSFFLCLNKKLSLHFLNKVCMFAERSYEKSVIHWK